MLLSWIVLFSSVLGLNSAIRCYICNGCTRFEKIHSKTCQEDQNMCMKIDLRTDSVSRKCANQQDCSEVKEEGTRHCCDQDNCNGSPVVKASYANWLTGLFVAGTWLALT